jgi:hypothetical protein
MKTARPLLNGRTARTLAAMTGLLIYSFTLPVASRDDKTHSQRISHMMMVGPNL